jgi:hypothetical protein
MIQPVERSNNVTMLSPVIFQRKVKFRNSVFVFKVQDYDEYIP